MVFTRRLILTSCSLFILWTATFGPDSINAFTRTIDSTDDVGFDTSLLVVNGNPAISYFDNTNGNLKYVRALDRWGLNWDTPVVVDANPGAGLYTSMTIVNGNPAIAYFYETGPASGQLMYVRANNADGTPPWGAPVVVDNTTADVGWDPSLAMVGTNPAISYFDNVNGQLRYKRATDANGAGWGPHVIADATPGAGMFTSMAVVNGNPAISYYYDNFPLGEVRYVRADSTDGSTWAVLPVTLDMFVTSLLPILGADASFPLAVINGRPAVSFMDWDLNTGDHFLHYIRANDTDGTAPWGAPVVADASPSAGTYSSLRTIGGRPAIAYFEFNSGILKYIQADNFSGTTWGDPPLVLDNNAGSGDYCSMIPVNGNPGVSYYDWANGNLKYTYYGSDIIPTLSQWGTILFTITLMIIAFRAFKPYPPMPE